jgi:predicted unusual protein kinase regulating ubiquinone biosynthesis (AarF/ABC1/UbiB family)
MWNRLLIPKDVERRVERGADRFYKLVLRLGGVMIKAGQQLSMRADILPPAYCDKLKLLLDEIPEKISHSDVLDALRRQTKGPWYETFRFFDFKNPLGSASVACVYNAELLTGERVAVKIRRPGIQKLFTADLNALDWILRVMEFLTIWKPGMSRNLRYELKDSLLEELDFSLEARYQEIFRRYHKRRRKLNVTAPKVYYKLSGEEVLVSEFVTGRKVKDIVEALRTRDEEYLEGLRRDGIDPKIVAKHLVRSRYYSFHECPLFHGDPHPSNVMVLPDNKIVMIDFGACGVFSERDRNLMWQLNYYYSQENVAGMVNMVISIMEPIHPVRDLHQFRKELLDEWWKGFYGIKSKHAEEWERTSFRLWLKFYQLMRKHQIPLPRNMIRMIRATLLYDTVAASLYRNINVFKEFQKYSEGVARRTRRKMEESAIRQIFLGPDDSVFQKVRQIATVANGLLYRVQKFLDDPEFSFASVAGKVYSAIRSVIRLFLLCSATGIVSVIVAGVLYQSGLMPTPGDVFQRLIIFNPRDWDFTPPYSGGALQIIALFWFVIVAVAVVAYGRRIYLRFGDGDD